MHKKSWSPAYVVLWGSAALSDEVSCGRLERNWKPTPTELKAALATVSRPY